MALVASLLFQKVSGKVGNKIYRRIRGKTYVHVAPVYNKDRQPTQKQLEVRAKFAAAAAYAKRVMAN